MEIKILTLAFLTVCFSCSQNLFKKKDCQLNGKVMMANTSYPIKTNIVVYQDNKKLAETNSNKEGFFEVHISKCKLKNDLIFVIEHKSKPDTIYNANGNKKMLYSCEGNDTIIEKIKSENIILLVKKCELKMINVHRVFEH